MPMRRELYPTNWDAIALTIKQQVNWRCEECKRPCKHNGETLVDFEQRLLGGAKLSEFIGQKRGQYVLTVAHLDHNPGNNAPENLKALCTVCHLRYDAKQHAISRYRNRIKRLEDLGQKRLW
jgi:hypothetical protein